MPDYTPEEMQYIYKDIKKRMNDRYETRAEFFSHFLAWIVIAVVGGLISSAYEQSIWQVIGLLWTAGLLIHGVHTLFEEQRERAIDRELERYGIRSRSALAGEKAKRDPSDEARLVTLSDDGELVDYDEDDYPARQSAN